MRALVVRHDGMAMIADLEEGLGEGEGQGEGQGEVQQGEGPDFIYEVKRQIVGGWLQMISGQVGDEKWTCWMDEEGKLKGQPSNPAATALAGALGWYWGDDYLVGNVVFLGVSEDGQDDADLPDAVLAVVQQMAGQ